MFGFLNINKPPGLTSRQVVNAIQRLVRPAKVGHAGTLDPLATGVLVVGVGPATRLIDYVQQLPKRYDATFILGCHADTEDVTGQVVELADPPRPAREEIQAALGGFLGEIWQRPPAYSALKIQGQRAYARARSGQSVELAKRQIRIDSLAIVTYDYPRLRLRIDCGSGTYVRSLGRDLAESLNTAAVMAELTRTSIGRFRLEDAWRYEDLDACAMADRLIPAASLFEGAAAVRLNDDEQRRVLQGQTLPRPQHECAGEVAACDDQGRLIAILGPRDADTLQPIRTFPHSR